nr:isochorismatase family cysteine hydrolase [Rhodococcus sp. HNM0569]
MPDEQTCTAFVVVDMQKDFFAPEPLARRKAQIVAAVNATAARARAAGALVVNVRTVHAPDRSTWALDMRDDGQGVVIDGTEGAEMLDELDLGPLDTPTSVEVTKTRDDAFVRTDLASILAEHSVRALALAGVQTEACVALTAASAYAYDIRVTIVSDAVATTSGDYHDSTLSWLADQYRQSVRPADEIEFTAPWRPGDVSEEPGSG